MTDPRHTDIADYHDVFAFADQPGHWQVIGLKDGLPFLLAADLPNEAIAEAWIRRAANTALDQGVGVPSP